MQSQQREEDTGVLSRQGGKRERALQRHGRTRKKNQNERGKGRNQNPFNPKKLLKKTLELHPHRKCKGRAEILATDKTECSSSAATTKKAVDRGRTGKKGRAGGGAE